LHPIQCKGDADEGLGEGMVEVIYLNCKHEEVINYYIIYNVNKCIQIDGKFDDHGAGAIQRDVHSLMEHIHGFMQSH
jgi:hypothetical protein